MIINDSCVVTLHYSLISDDGQQLDASHESEPLIYLHGTKSLLTGLEKGIEGHRTGDEFNVTVQPEEGYGLTDPAQIHKVPRDAFSETRNLAVGMQFELESEEGHGEQFTVIAINGEEITVDENHPLAGKVLHFKVSIEMVRAATEDEIDAGYAQE